MSATATYVPITVTGTGAAPPIPVTWSYIDPSHIKVTKTVSGVDTVLTLGTDYTVTGSLGSTGRMYPSGTVTPTASIAIGTTWRVERITPRVQPDVLRTGGAYSPTTVEAMLDRLALIAQEYPNNAVVGPGDLLLRGNLADSSPGLGAALMSFKQRGTASAIRTALGKFAELPSVMDKIPESEHAAIYAGTSTLDVTSYIQQAVNDYTHCRIPDGLFNITAAINIPANHEVIGSGSWATYLTRAGSAQSYFVLGQNAGLHGVYCKRSGAITATTGRLVDVSVSGCRVTDVYADHFWDGLYVTNCAGLFLDRIYLNNWQNIGINVNGGTNDVLLSNFILTGPFQGQAIKLSDKAEAIVATNGEVIGGANGLQTTAASFAAGVRPAYCKFTNVFFDSSTSGVDLSKCIDMRFTNCWFSNRPGNGVTLNAQAVDTMFVNCDMANCGSSGAYINSTTAVGTQFIGCSMLSNNTQNNGSNGLTVGAGCTDFTVIGGRYTNSLGFGTQGYGIYIAPGASDRYTIIGADVRGNGTGGIGDGGTGTNKKITGNQGFEPAFIAPTFTSSWTNLGAGTEAAGYVKDADGFVILRGLITGGTVGNSAFTLPTGYRPANNESFPVNSNSAFGAVQVTSAGLVNILSPSTNTWVALSGIRFKAV
jgi:hypothetical protein